jgi:hypothetical protein
MEQIGRELRKAYSPPENLPPRLGVLLMQLERKGGRSAATVKDRRKRRGPNRRA